MNTVLLTKPINLLYGNKKLTIIYFLTRFCYIFYLYFFSRWRPYFFSYEPHLLMRYYYERVFICVRILTEIEPTCRGNSARKENSVLLGIVKCAIRKSQRTTVERYSWMSGLTCEKFKRFYRSNFYRSNTTPFCVVVRDSVVLVFKTTNMRVFMKTVLKCT